MTIRCPPGARERLTCSASPTSSSVLSSPSASSDSRHSGATPMPAGDPAPSFSDPSLDETAGAPLSDFSYTSATGADQSSVSDPSAPPPSTTRLQNVGNDARCRVVGDTGEWESDPPSEVPEVGDVQGVGEEVVGEDDKGKRGVEEGEQKPVEWPDDSLGPSGVPRTAGGVSRTSPPKGRVGGPFSGEARGPEGTCGLTPRSRGTVVDE